MAWSGSAPGPVSPRDWLEGIYDYAITAIKPENLFLGLPAYGWNWQIYTDPAALGKAYRGTSNTYYAAQTWMKGGYNFTGVSSGKDAMLHSLLAQVSYYSDLIQGRWDWLYCGVYADEAKTGTKDSRGEFQRLISDCRSGRLDMVITRSISRFARNTVTLLETVRELKSLGVDVYFEEQNIHTMSGDGGLMMTILASGWCGIATASSRVDRGAPRLRSAQKPSKPCSSGPITS